MKFLEKMDESEKEDELGERCCVEQSGRAMRERKERKRMK